MWWWYIRNTGCGSSLPQWGPLTGGTLLDSPKRVPTPWTTPISVSKSRHRYHLESRSGLYPYLGPTGSPFSPNILSRVHGLSRTPRLSPFTKDFNPFSHRGDPESWGRYTTSPVARDVEGSVYREINLLNTDDISVLTKSLFPLIPPEVVFHPKRSTLFC